MGQTLGWILWLVGGVMIVASWAQILPVEIGWGGFGIAVVGMLMSSATRREQYERQRFRDQEDNERGEYRHHDGRNKPRHDIAEHS